MKDRLIPLIEHALDTLRDNGTLPGDARPPVQIDRTKDKSHGDFATNIALMLAKPAGLKPRDLAQSLIEALPDDPAVAKVEIAGPGFINFFQAAQWLNGQLEAALDDPYLAVPRPQHAQTVVVDYSSPNLAKEMHVGHLRSTIIGDAVVRTLAFLGHKVVPQNHVGDWGTQFGMLLAYLE
ncbi:MAG TPA: arginine--tRNA ligase, partial [Alcanivorax sp.]|nr:arginine--tRNA ligase [Alcanivorax sp.]